MSTTRTVVVWENAVDLTALARNLFNFNIAKSVIDSEGKKSFNLVWHSNSLSPITSISWDVQYAFNWTAQLPTAAISVTTGGFWKDCRPGQVFDIDENGLFVNSQAEGKTNFMKIGTNNCARGAGIHVVIGIKIGPGSYQPIWVDSTELGVGMSSWYQPQEEVQWWYEKGTRSATMISGAETDIETFNMSTPRPSDGKYYVSTTYIYAHPPGTSGWRTTQTEAPQSVTLFVESGVDRALDSIKSLSENDRYLLLARLASLLGTPISGKPLELAVQKFVFSATVSWPVTVSIMAVSLALVKITSTLADKDYETEKTIQHGDRKYTVAFRPRKTGSALVGETDAAGAALKAAEAAWNAALAADAQDGPSSTKVTEATE